MSKKNVIEDDLAWVTASNWTCLIFKALIKDMEMKIIQKLYSHNRERRLLTFYVQFWFYKEGIIIVIFPERRWHIDGQWTVQRCGFDWVSKIDFLRQSRLYWTHLLRFPKIYELHDINNYILILGFCCYVLLTIKHWVGPFKAFIWHHTMFLMPVKFNDESEAFFSNTWSQPSHAENTEF